MKNDSLISRRSLLFAASAGMATLFINNTTIAQTDRPRREGRGNRGNRAERGERVPPVFNNADFYDSNGKFLEEKAKDAVLEMCRYHRYPIFPKLRENLYVTDYGIGEFTTVGLACVFFANNVDGPYSYMMLDIYLLPNQMLAEHWHLVPEKTPNCAQKNEGWLVRHGRSYVVGEGDPNLPPEVVVPKCHAEGKVTVENCVIADPGDFVPLGTLGSHHWQLAGKEGAIITEVANAHDGASVRHLDPKANAAFLD